MDDLEEEVQRRQELVDGGEVSVQGPGDDLTLTPRTGPFTSSTAREHWKESSDPVSFQRKSKMTAT